MEIYQNTADVIELRIPSGSNYVAADDVNVTLRNTAGQYVAEVVNEPATERVVPEGTVYEFEVPMTATTLTRPIIVEWQYTINGVAGSKFDSLEVVTPYVTPAELLDWRPELEKYASYSQIKQAERVVRHVIDTFCRQSFNMEYGLTLRTMGKDQDVLWLRKRLVKLNALYANHGNVTDNVTFDQGGGWTLRYKGPYGFYPYRDIKRDVGPGMSISRVSPYFREGVTYIIEGDFGWRHVPGMVNQAAKLLVWDQFQPDSEWRKRNVDVLRAADWRIEYASAPITTTGNIDADLMLQNYTVPGVVIL